MQGPTKPPTIVRQIHEESMDRATPTEVGVQLQQSRQDSMDPDGASVPEGEYAMHDICRFSQMSTENLGATLAGTQS